MNFNNFYNSRHHLTENDFFKKDIKIYKETYGLPDILFENPMFTGNYGGYFNNNDFNEIRASSVINDAKYIKDFSYANNVFKLFRSVGENLTEDSLVWRDKLIGMYVYYRLLKDGGIEIDSSWNHRELEGLFRNYFWNELFPNYVYIQSSNKNSKFAVDFWIKICKEANERGCTFSVKSLSNEWEEIYKDYKKLEKDKNEIWNNYSGDLRLRVYK
jgi:hypothetical protein